MSKYQRVTTSLIITSAIGNIDIVKYQKAGTSRTFWTPEYDGKRITTTMYARLGQAEKVAKAFLSWKREQAEKPKAVK